MNKDNEITIIDRLSCLIQDVKKGLEPDVLAFWYNIIGNEVKVACPEELRKSVSVYQDPVLPMKFEFRASRRTVPFILNAIENNLNSMPFATRLYFLKFEEIIQQEFYKNI